MPWLDAIRRFADRLAEHPHSFHWLRKLPEANFRQTKRRIAAVRSALGNPRTLDVGCGTGEYSTLFDPERYVGVDLNAGYLALARRRNRTHRYLVGDARTWPGDGTIFDLVLVNGVLHHLDDADAGTFLRSVEEHLAPGGTLLVIEDVQLPDPPLGARLVHQLDYGHHIRNAEQWQKLVETVATIDRSETYVSGICPYHLMLCRKPAR
jgi:SAM-dependent methyltransferase